MATSKSKPGRPAKVVKPKARSKRTETTRNYRYKSFNERISGLRIDPVRRKRDQEEREALEDERATFFGRALARWRDVNLSHDFASFARQAAPLADNLPLLLHNQDQILTILVEHIERRDALALEPLLGLMADFAHDLDVRFEKHFPLAVQTVTAVAAKHAEPSVVEWSFNCLAWLFKYLSRLLAPDLKPVYQLMAPYLGKELQKHYIVRFAAESLCFLLRKSASTYERDATPLQSIIQYILNDLEEDGEADGLYAQGVMVLFTDAAKGVQQSLHSTGLPILKTIFETVRRHPSATSLAVLRGAITSLIHFSTPATFEPILDLVLSDCEAAALEDTPGGLDVSAEMLFTVLSVRKGSRVSDWGRTLTIVSSLAKAGQTSSRWTTKSRIAVASIIATTTLYCTDVIKLSRPGLLDCVWQDEWAPYFLRISDYVARVVHERYERHLADKMKQFLKTPQVLADLDELLLLVPSLFTISTPCKLPETVQMSLIKPFKQLTVRGVEQNFEQARATTIISALPYLELSDVNNDAIQASLQTILQNTIDATDAAATNTSFVLGLVLQQWLQMTADCSVLPGILLFGCRSASTQYTSPRFWTSMLALMRKQNQASLFDVPLDALRSAMTQALTLSDHDLRTIVLDLFEVICQKQGQDTPAALATGILIESIPIAIDTGRTISMNVRKLILEYGCLGAQDPLRSAIPSFCLGLLHSKLATIWDDAIDTLGQLCKTATAEETMMQTLQAWLFEAPTQAPQAEPTQLVTANQPVYQITSDFECPNLARTTALSQQLFTTPHGGRPGLVELSQQNSITVSAIPDIARDRALRVLSKLPHIAEKRSRLLVPILLRLTGQDEEDEEDVTAAWRWNRKDKKALLNVFSQFTNPKVLYKHAEVHDALMRLCTNGDVDVQKAALKALLAWKTPEIVRYEEHLSALLDDARFREELSVFLQGGEEEGIRKADLPIVMPVLLRLLYGRLIGGSKEGQQVKRKAVFVALSTFSVETLAELISITLGSARDIEFVRGGALQESALAQLTMSRRQQLGMLTMLVDMIDTLGSAIEPLAGTVLNTVIGCCTKATKELSGLADGDKQESLIRAIRTNALQVLHKLFSKIESQSLTDGCQAIAMELLPFHQERFVSENNQAVSATLRIISAWAKSTTYISYLFAKGDGLLSAVTELFAASTTKLPVRLFSLSSILDPVLAQTTDASISTRLIDQIASSVAQVLQSQQDPTLLDASVVTLQLLAARLEDEAQASSILAACQSLLIQSTKIVALSTKLGLLRTMIPLLDTHASMATPELYHAVCGLFSRIHDSKGREVLSQAFSRLARRSPETAQVADICQDLNKVFSGKLDQPDYSSREAAFFRIYQESSTWGWEQWAPVTHNCLHFLRDEDTVNRASAAKALLQLIRRAVENKVLLPLVQSDLFGAIQRGMAHKSEFIRAEYLGLLQHIVLQHKDWTEVNDLQSLAIEGEEDEAVLADILHIQHHRRLQALRRLGESSSVSSKNIVRLFLPLLEHFIFDAAEGDAGRTLSDHAVLAVGLLARRLRWSDLRQMLLRYYGYLKSKDDLEKTILRLIGATVDGLVTSLKVTQADLTEPMPLPEQRVNVVLKDFLPPLQSFLHQKDESKVDRRVGVAISIVKLAKLLPEDEFVAKLAPTLTDVSHILRSRDMEAREQTRRTLSVIFGLVGPNYLQYIVKQLRSALLRGYQLHVLSYTVHSLLVTNGAQFKSGDIDECVPELTAIILDDIFGITGQEKDAEEYKSGMKEVKSSKSYDTMEIVARMASLSCLGQLILPIRDLLNERLDSKMVKKTDDLLLRIRKGIDQNPVASSRDMLAFCHELVRQNSIKESASSSLQDWKLKKYLQTGKRAGSTKGSTTSYAFKLTAFALALTRKVLHRHEDLQTSANLAGFVPMIKNGLVAGESDVKIQSAKLLSVIMRVKSLALDISISELFQEAMAMVTGSLSTTSDPARAGLELATSVLRERQENVDDKDVGLLLNALRADIDEPERHSQTFRFLRAVLGRKLVIPEVYTLMEEVARVMISHNDENVKQNARGAYIQFVLDYPQSKARWQQTVTFLVQNMAYEHAGGRKSVLEVIYSLLGRVDEESVQENLLVLFIGLVQRITNDPDGACQGMARNLAQRAVEKAGDGPAQEMKNAATKWLGSSKDSVRHAAIVAWTIVVRADQADKQDIVAVLNVLPETIQGDPALCGSSLDLLSTLCELAPQQAFASAASKTWSAVVASLTKSDELMQSRASKLLLMLYNDVASTTAKHGDGLKAAKLQTSSGLVLSSKMWCQQCAVHLQAIRQTEPDQIELITAVSKNLVFLARLFAANDIQWQADGEEDDDDEEEGEDHGGRSALGYLLSRLIYVVRREDASAINRTAALQTTGAIISLLTDNVPNVKHLVRALYVLTDPSIPQATTKEHRALTDKAREVMDLVQSKIDSEKYIEYLAQARKDIHEKRDERRQKRRIDAVSNPERYMKDKRKKHLAEKARVKNKASMHRTQRRGVSLG